MFSLIKCPEVKLIDTTISLIGETFSTILELSVVTPSLDLFASCITHKLPCYASLVSDSKASKIDAFSFSWRADLYIFPPLPLLSRFAQKIKFDESEAIILATSAWPGLVSLLIILSLLISNPIFIPCHHLLGQAPTMYPFNMMALNISTIVERIENYLKKLALPSPLAYPMEL